MASPRDASLELPDLGQQISARLAQAPGVIDRRFSVDRVQRLESLASGLPLLDIVRRRWSAGQDETQQGSSELPYVVTPRPAVPDSPWRLLPPNCRCSAYRWSRQNYRRLRSAQPWRQPDRRQRCRSCSVWPADPLGPRLRLGATLRRPRPPVRKRPVMPLSSRARRSAGSTRPRRRQRLNCKSSRRWCSDHLALSLRRRRLHKPQQLRTKPAHRLRSWSPYRHRPFLRRPGCGSSRSWCGCHPAEAHRPPHRSPGKAPPRLAQPALPVWLALRRAPFPLVEPAEPKLSACGRVARSRQSSETSQRCLCSPYPSRVRGQCPGSPYRSKPSRRWPRERSLRLLQRSRVASCRQQVRLLRPGCLASCQELMCRKPWPCLAAHSQVSTYQRRLRLWQNGRQIPQV